MADAARRRRENVPGPLFVDETCIDCGTCMWMAPEVYEDVGGMSAVVRQPATGGPTDPAGRADAATAAIAACPTGSIGHDDPAVARAAAAAFPRPFMPDVWHLGFHARSSFGAAAWLFRTPEGNVMVDSPRFVAPLAKRIEDMGGIDKLLLTHRDDVADHARWAERFGCERVIHVDDRTAATEDVECVVEGRSPVDIGHGARAIPVPGHTKGSMCFLWRGVLFTGDHLCARGDRLHAFRRACWHDWGEQTRSMERLAGERFHAVLPGHGAPAAWDEATMQARLGDLIAWMHTS